jgi:energy-coupling factor transporter ATP-binding protein EcfA2
MLGATATANRGVDQTTLVLRAKEVTVRSGGTLVLGAVRLCVLPGETRGLAGPNGAGKTTLLNPLSGSCARARPSWVVVLSGALQARQAFPQTSPRGPMFRNDARGTSWRQSRRPKCPVTSHFVASCRARDTSGHTSKSALLALIASSTSSRPLGV